MQAEDIPGYMYDDLPSVLRTLSIETVEDLHSYMDDECIWDEALAMFTAKWITQYLKREE